MFKKKKIKEYEEMQKELLSRIPQVFEEDGKRWMTYLGKNIEVADYFNLLLEQNDNQWYEFSSFESEEMWFRIMTQEEREKIFSSYLSKSVRWKIHLIETLQYTIRYSNDKRDLNFLLDLCRHGEPEVFIDSLEALGEEYIMDLPYKDREQLFYRLCKFAKEGNIYLAGEKFPSEAKEYERKKLEHLKKDYFSDCQFSDSQME